MTKKEYYEHELGLSNDWTQYLLENSNLPGPRANLELMQAFVEMGSENDFLPLIDYTPDTAPVNSPEEFLAFCGTAGLGELISSGLKEYLPDLRNQASDPRWRIREAVGMGLQIIGKHDFELLSDICTEWVEGNLLEQRAVAAGISSPSILVEPGHAEIALRFLEKITGNLSLEKDRKNEEFRVLTKGLSYCWSVAVAANPDKGKSIFEKAAQTDDPEVLRIIKENLKKNRLINMDPEWSSRLLASL